MSALTLNPDLPVPDALEPLIATGLVAYSDRLGADDVGVLHVCSPFEHVALSRLIPTWVQERGVRVAVTLYDLIPEVFPDRYLDDPLTRRWYRSRQSLVRSADLVLAISEATAADAERFLGVPASAIRVVGGGVSPMFNPGPGQNASLVAAQGSFPWLRAGFLLFTGGIDYRKNLPGLLAGYSRISHRERLAHQLVIVCALTPGGRTDLEGQCSRLQIADTVHCVGYVDDRTLVDLYRAATLFVFPSLYEGYGLPVVEALACGTPAIVGDNSSLRELVPDAQRRFDSSDPAAIGAALGRALSSPQLTRRVTTGVPARHSWVEVGAAIRLAWLELLDRGNRPATRRSRPRLAIVAPLPPARSGIADVTAALIPEIARHWDVDAFAPDLIGDLTPIPGCSIHPISVFDAVESEQGTYDNVLYCLGNSEHHIDALELLRRRPGSVLLHDVRLVSLYAELARRKDAPASSLRDNLHWITHGRVPGELASNGISNDTIRRLGLLMSAEVLELAEQVFVHSRFAAALAALESPGSAQKVRVLPFGVADSSEFPPPRDPALDPMISSFGFVDHVKNPELLVQAFAEVAMRKPTARLVFAGPIGSVLLEQLRLLAARLDVGDRIAFTGDLEGEAFRAAISDTTVAVQLRASTNGETSAAIGSCLSAGIPVVATAIGPLRELPDDAVLHVSHGADAREVAGAILALIDDTESRSARIAAGHDWALRHSFSVVADSLTELLSRARSPSLPSG